MAVGLLMLAPQAACTAGPEATSGSPAGVADRSETPAGGPGRNGTPTVGSGRPTRPAGSARAPQPPTATAAAAPGRESGGWTVTVYYTAVERYHSGRATRVTGCPTIDCAHGSYDLGSYPAGFLAAVKDEGTGRTNGGRYLNWSHDVGYWLDDAPRDTAGRPLRPFESAAADPGVLRPGTRFTVVACGHDGDGAAIDHTVCARLRTARWTVTDEFTPGLGGADHVDVYIGEETGPDFTDSAWYTMLVDARLAVG